MIKRQLPFILAATDYGPMILSRLDYMKYEENEYGVGHELLSTAQYEDHEGAVFRQALDYRRQQRGDGVVMIDGGANIGVFTIDMAKHMTGWGRVIAIEAQERIYYALCGNIALNNHFNAWAMNVALSDKIGTIDIPTLDYTISSSFGSFELKPLDERELMGQQVNYSNHLTRIPCFTIDSLNLERCDFIKLDIEGMELEALKGSEMTLNLYHPIIYAEYHKVGEDKIKAFLEPFGYKIYHNYRNLICFHESDAKNIDVKEETITVEKKHDPRDAEYVKIEEKEASVAQG